MQKAILYRGKDKETALNLTASIEKDTGDLVISGHDLGSKVEEFWGESEYEYWLRIPKDQKLILLASLDGKTGSENNAEETDAILLRMLTAKFNTPSAFSDLRKWCEAKQISAAFSNYV